jgi:hypothetical protein
MTALISRLDRITVSPPISQRSDDPRGRVLHIVTG